MTHDQKLILVVLVFAGIVALVGFALGVVAYCQDSVLNEVVHSVTLKNQTVVDAAPMTDGTFFATVTTVPNGGSSTWGDIDQGVAALATDWSALTIQSTGSWKQVGELVWFQSTVRWDVTGGPFTPGVGIPTPGTYLDEVRFEFVSGDMWPIAKTAGKHCQLEFSMYDSLGNLYGLDNNANQNGGQMLACMLKNGAIQLLAMKGDLDSEGAWWGDWSNGAGGQGACDLAFAAGAAWFETRVQGLYQLS